MDYAELLVPFAEAANVRARDVAGVLRARLVVSLSFVDAPRLHAAWGGASDVDWTRARAFVSDSAFGAVEWTRLLALMRFEREPPTRPVVLEFVTSAVAGLRVSTQGRSLTPIETMRLCFARSGLGATPAWDTLAKSLILTNLADVDACAALEPFLTRTRAEAVLKHLSAHKHSRDEYTAAFAALLSDDTCHIDAHVALRDIQARDEARHRLLRAPEQNNGGKPSLTRLLAQIGEADDASSFRRFCMEARLPGSAHTRRRQACYYFACLPPTHRSTSEAAFRMLSDDPSVRQALEACVVASPDQATLRAFVGDARHSGSVCSALRVFRQRCVPWKECSWTQVLRLYLAAYCVDTRELWAFVLAQPPTIQRAPNELANDIAVILQQLPPFATEALVPILVQTTEKDGG
jgi:hypothetical protein